MLASWEGRRFIIEFKREERTVWTEFRKPHRMELLRILASSDGAARRSLSKRGHFLAFGAAIDGTAELVFMRYCDVTYARRQETGPRTDMNQFIKAMRNGVGLDPTEFKNYLLLLKECYDKAGSAPRAETAGDGGVSVSSLVVNYDDKRNQVSFAMVDFSRDLERALDLDFDPPQRSKSRTRGPERDGGLSGRGGRGGRGGGIER